MDPIKLAAAEAAAAEWEEANALAAAGDDDRRPVIDLKEFAVNQVRTAVSPDCSFRLLRDALQAAQTEIVIYIYNLTADHVLKILHDRLDHGVKVWIMYDARDVRGGEVEKIEKLADKGAEVKVAASTGGRKVFSYCHQKYVVVDGKVVVLGSANWASSSLPNVPTPHVFRKGNREWLVRVDDEKLAEWFIELFDKDWDIPDFGGPSGEGELPPELMEAVPVPATLVKIPDDVYDIETFALDQARVVPVLSPDNYFDEVKTLFENATVSIDVEQQYILAGGRVTDLLALLEQKRDAGVTVRIIVSPAFRKVGVKDNWELSREALDAFNLKDSLRALSLDTFTHCHNKGVIVDRKTVIVSSTNWSVSSIQKARESGLLIESEKVAGYYAQVFDDDWDLLSWAESDVPNNLAALAAEALFTPGGVIELEAGELV